MLKGVFGEFAHHRVRACFGAVLRLAVCVRWDSGKAALFPLWALGSRRVLVLGAGCLEWLTLVPFVREWGRPPSFALNALDGLGVYGA